MRLVTLIAMIAGAIMFSSATPEPACAFEFCSGLKPIQATAKAKLGCENICAVCKCDADPDRDPDRDRFADEIDCRWAWVCCQGFGPAPRLPVD